MLVGVKSLLHCTQITAIGLGSAGCNQQQVCCQNNSAQGLIVLACNNVGLLGWSCQNIDVLSIQIYWNIENKEFGLAKWLLCNTSIKPEHRHWLRWLFIMGQSCIVPHTLDQIYRVKGKCFEESIFSGDTIHDPQSFIHNWHRAKWKIFVGYFATFIETFINNTFWICLYTNTKHNNMVSYPTWHNVINNVIYHPYIS